MDYRPPERVKRLDCTASQKPGLQVDSRMDTIFLDNEYRHGLIHHDSIRLLYIEPGTENDEISCCLLVAPRETATGYEALSSCWGRTRECHRILIDSKSFYIRLNLYHALRRLRQADRPIIIWVDALCISQSDTGEKTAQVSKMAMVFLRAQNVLI